VDEGMTYLSIYLILSSSLDIMMIINDDVESDYDGDDVSDHNNNDDDDGDDDSDDE
jgi:hypothetical protein